MTRDEWRVAGAGGWNCATPSPGHALRVHPLPQRGEGATPWHSRGEGPLSVGHRTHRKTHDVCATRVTAKWLKGHLKKSVTPMLAVPMNSMVTTYFLRKDVAAEVRISPPKKSWR